jgi:type II secretory pathway pseudopilin PulG
MVLSSKTRRAGGFLLTELIVSITVVGLILLGLSLSMGGAARFNRYEWSRQQCIAAAQAQIDSLTATGQPLSDEQIERLWPKIAVTVNRCAGEGQWSGLDLLEVTATVKVGSLPAKVRLARYVQSPVRSVAGGASL